MDDFRYIQADNEKKVGDVKGLSVLFGKAPSCHCNRTCRVHICLKQNHNFEKMFYRCPLPIGQQRRKYQWLEIQPFLELGAWKYKEQPGQAATSYYAALQEMVQDTCGHLETTKLGSNAYIDKLSCKTCGKELSRRAKLVPGLAPDRPRGQ